MFGYTDFLVFFSKTGPAVDSETESNQHCQKIKTPNTKVYSLKK